MSELFSKLGLNWKLLLAQGVNFSIILVVLRLVAYKPIMKVLESRRKKIEQGLNDAKEAGEKLKNAEHVYASKMREAETDGIKVFTKLEAEAKAKEAVLIASARAKETEILKAAEKAAHTKEEEAEARVHAGAISLVRSAIEKTVSLKPNEIDEALVKQALESLKNART